MSELQGIVHGMTDEVYHARPELSSTGVRLLLPEYKGSPKKFRHAQTVQRTSRAYDVGHAAHAKVLGVGVSIVVYPTEHLTPSGNVSTSKATQAWEAEQRADGLTPVSPDEVGRVDALAEAILAHDTARPFFEVAAHREVSIFADVDGVPCRARFDALSDETRSGVFAVDLKTTDDATKSGFERTVAKYGYDVQEAHYEAVYQASEGRPIDEFVFVVAEKAAPHEVAVFRLPDMWMAMGRVKAARARQIYSESVESGQWPGYTNDVQFLDPPTWVVFQHETQYEYGEISI